LTKTPQNPSKCKVRVFVTLNKKSQKSKKSKKSKNQKNKRKIEILKIKIRSKKLK